MSRTHGKSSTYRAGCRCTDCRAAEAVRTRVSRARRAADPAAADRAGHGKENTYTNYRCRCTDCRAARREWEQQRRTAARSGPATDRLPAADERSEDRAW